MRRPSRTECLLAENDGMDAYSGGFPGFLSFP